MQIINDTCQHPSLWMVSWLFRYAGKASQAVDRCALSAPGAGCVCRDAVEAQIVCDLALGYPSEITTRQNWSAAWQRPGYWI